jgi:hypothetical protein
MKPVSARQSLDWSASISLAWWQHKYPARNMYLLLTCLAAQTLDKKHKLTSSSLHPFIPFSSYISSTTTDFDGKFRVICSPEILKSVNDTG